MLAVVISELNSCTSELLKKGGNAKLETHISDSFLGSFFFLSCFMLSVVSTWEEKRSDTFILYRLVLSLHQSSNKNNLNK